MSSSRRMLEQNIVNEKFGQQLQKQSVFHLDFGWCFLWYLPLCIGFDIYLFILCIKHFQCRYNVKHRLWPRLYSLRLHLSLCGAEGAEDDGDLQEAADLLHPADHARPHHAARTRGRGLASCPAPTLTSYQGGVLKLFLRCCWSFQSQPSFSRFMIMWFGSNSGWPIMRIK